MPICGVRNSRLRAGEVVVEQEAGKCYVFDDSFEHEVKHERREDRGWFRSLINLDWNERPGMTEKRQE